MATTRAAAAAAAAAAACLLLLLLSLTSGRLCCRRWQHTSLLSAVFFDGLGCCFGRRRERLIAS